MHFVSGHFCPADEIAFSRQQLKCETRVLVSSAVLAALCMQVEFSTSAAELPAHWNTCTGNFLRRCECPVSQV